MGESRLSFPEANLTRPLTRRPVYAGLHDPRRFPSISPNGGAVLADITAAPCRSSVGVRGFLCRETSAAGRFIAPAAVDALAAAIQTQEGYYPGSLAYLNNNPGNLVFVGQPGASPGDGGFASFSSYNADLQALKNQINARCRARDRRCR